MMTELEMIQHVKAQLEAQGVTCLTEVPFMSRSIDMIVISENEIVAIEFKKRNWKKAAEQARDYQMGADRSYVCLAPRRAYKVVEEHLGKRGIGILCFDASAESGYSVVREAERPSKQWSVAKEWLLQAVERRLTASPALV